MRARTWAGAALLGVVLALMGWAFGVIIWKPLYGSGRAGRAPAPEAPPPDPELQAELLKEDGTSSRRWSETDARALSRLREELRRADFSGAPPPKSDGAYRLRIRRPDAKADEYEVLLDQRGSDPDLVYVIRRNGGMSAYGTAAKTPELKAALEQLLKKEAPAGALR